MHWKESQLTGSVGHSWSTKRFFDHSFWVYVLYALMENIHFSPFFYASSFFSIYMLITRMTKVNITYTTQDIERISWLSSAYIKYFVSATFAGMVCSFIYISYHSARSSSREMMSLWRLTIMYITKWKKDNLPETTYVFCAITLILLRLLNHCIIAINTQFISLVFLE